MSHLSTFDITSLFSIPYRRLLWLSQAFTSVQSDVRDTVYRVVLSVAAKICSTCLCKFMLILLNTYFSTMQKHYFRHFISTHVSIAYDWLMTHFLRSRLDCQESLSSWWLSLVGVSAFESVIASTLLISIRVCRNNCTMRTFIYVAFVFRCVLCIFDNCVVCVLSCDICIMWPLRRNIAMYMWKCH